MPLIALSGCGQGDSIEVVTIPAESVQIEKDCGLDPITGAEGTHLYAKNLGCNKAAEIVSAVPDSDCRFDQKPVCRVVEDFACRRRLEDNGRVSVITCAKGRRKAVTEAYTLEYYNQY